jgi:hypothetical protein
MFQSELFIPAALEHKETGLRQLDEFDFKAAAESFAIAKEIDPYLADLDFLILLGEYGRDHGVKPKTPAAALTALWHRARKDFDEGDLPLAAHRHLQQLLARRILQIGQFTPAGFCGEKEKILHRGVLHAALNEWQEAHQTLLNLVTEAREQALPLHWGCLGDAAHLLRRWKDANMAYVGALFSDPFEIDLQMLQHAEMREVLETLRREVDEESLARALWPFHVWMKGIVQIPRGNTFLLPLVQKQRSIIGSELMLEPARRARQFSLCLYIDQSGLQGEIQFDAREEMKNLAPENFSLYLQEIERRAAQSRPR